MKKRIPIIVDSNCEEQILNLLGNKTNNQGFIVDEQDRPVLTRDAETVRLDDLAIIRKGSKIFIKKDIVSLVKYAADLI